MLYQQRLYNRQDINSIRAKLFRGNENIYLHSISFLHIGMTQVVEILPQVREELTYSTYRKTSNISRTLVGNIIVDNSDAVGASPVGAAPTTSSFST